MAEFSDPADAFDALIDGIGEVDNADMLEVGHAAVALVVARTKSGRDADGKKFTAYSPSYTEVRINAGLSASPDLVRTGHMIGSMTPLVTGPNEVTVAFPSDVEATKAGANNDGTKRGTPKREFLDVRLPHEVNFIAEVAGEAVARRVRNKIR